MTFINNADAVPNLRVVSQRAVLVDTFIQAVRSVKNEPSDQLFANLANMYRRTLDAADVVDKCVAFTADFFDPDKLEIISEWIERRRQERLQDKGEVRPQRLKDKFEKIMGHGVERMPLSLSDALRSTGIALKLDQRKATASQVLKKASTAEN